MYKVEIPADTLERAAITRRQTLDAERKKRIFDPKVDLQGLDKQVQEKQAMEAQLKERDAAFASNAKLTTSILEAMDDQVLQARRQTIRDIATFRATEQQPHQRREFDLNDPRALWKECPPRSPDATGEELEACGVSALQRFEGEDLAHEARLALQKQQMKVWVKEQALEKLLQHQSQEAEERQYASLQQNVLSKLDTLHQAVEDARREQLKLDKEFNLHLAEEKRRKEAAQKQQETQANLQEIYSQINGPFLTENSDAFNVRGKVKVRVDVFKGMTEEQRQNVREVQEQQRLEKEMAKLRARQTEQLWNAQSRATDRTLTLLEREKARQLKALSARIQGENEEKKQEDKLRQNYLDKVVYTNPPKEEYFAQFNTTSPGILSLLEEQEEELNIYALQKLDLLVDQFWVEISESISKIEILYENESFKRRELAALVASKVYYHLGELDESLTFALGAGTAFDVAANSEYVDAIISKAIDTYIAARHHNHEHPAEIKPVDGRLEKIVNLMFQRCFQDGEFKQAIGIALEALRLDAIQEAVTKAKFDNSLLTFILTSSLTTVSSLTFRNEVLRLLVTTYRNLEEPDYISEAQCLLHLKDSANAAAMLQTLAARDAKHQLIAYQIAFDLQEGATQDFLNHTLQCFPEGGEPSEFQANIRLILSGQLATSLELEFLSKNNKTDLLILQNTKAALESRNSALHASLSFANAFMSAGTTSDDFLRQSLDWLAKASNWTKFSATAALGIIHKGQIAKSKTLLAPYLPQDGIASSAYSEGGALFALGLIHTNHGMGVLEYLQNALQSTQQEVVQHGACLGLGVAGMATGSERIYEDLKAILFSDSAVAGEAAGLAMGLVMLGTAAPKPIEEMLQYAHETQHEKIIRGLAIGISLIMYGKEELADALITQLLGDKDPILRYGGIYTVAMAYAGTGDNRAIKKLLHLAVSDVNDDVRRASVTALGFILFNNPAQVPRIVQLLSESYNPHVRYGATFALGIACAGTGSLEALKLLEPLAKDNVEYVRQGAYIAQAMILVQQNETSHSRVAGVRDTLVKVIADKHEDIMAVFGAVLAQGILEAGGRNVTISCRSQAGHASPAAIVGLSLFSQFWYWYPCTHFLSLAFKPTAMIGVNGKLEMPELEFLSMAKPSMFAYPTATKVPVAAKVELVKTAVLSTTAKSKARAKKREGAEGATAMDLDESVASAAAPAAAAKAEGTLEDAASPAPEGDKASEPEKSKDKVPEPDFQTLPNLSRVVPGQLKYITFPPTSRYVPVKKGAQSGILVMEDKRPGEPETLIPLTSKAAAAAPAGDATMAEASGAEEEGEPSPPAPFEYPLED